MLAPKMLYRVWNKGRCAGLVYARAEYKNPNSTWPVRVPAGQTYNRDVVFYPKAMEVK